MPSPWRTRVALGLISFAAIGLQLALMWSLSLRLWSHFAAMVISVALLGFGASGTALTLLRNRVQVRPRRWLAGLCFGFALSVPLSVWAGRLVPLDVQFLAWGLSQAGNVVALELLMLAPFLLAGGAVGVALMDRPERVGGHYAANLVGSGVGAAGAVLLMFVLDSGGLFAAMSAAGCAAGLVLVRWRPIGRALPCLAVTAAVVALASLTVGPPAVSPYKTLAQAQSWPGTRIVHRDRGPLGRIDVLAGPAVHLAPGLSLRHTDLLPEHALLVLDGDQASPIYDVRDRAGWAFLDQTTAAAAYHLRPRPRVCLVGAGGGADIGLALFHDSPAVLALELNRQVIAAMTGPLAERGGRVYRAPGVTVLNREARGFFATTDRTFDLIQLPAIDAFGATGAGLAATAESYLYTVESFAAMLDRLDDGGVLAVTRWARTPPRDELRAFDLAAQALRRLGLEPADRLAMIRSWATVTVLASPRPLTAEQADALRRFCAERGFDLCYLPGMERGEANRFHVLAEPYYFDAAAALLGPRRQAFLDDYLFVVDATTDDRPFFFQAFRLRSWPVLREHMGQAGRAFLEVGTLTLLAALVQAAGLGLALIVLPLLAGVGAVRRAPGKVATLGYFLLLGVGFMLLEISFLQRLVLYLAHPIYAAAAVIAAFLVFAGLGSGLSGRWPGGPRRVIPAAGLAVVALGLLYLFGLNDWLAVTQARPVAVRFAVAVLTIAPLAAAMGHLFPAGLRSLGGGAAALVPWAWAVNGFASVVAAAAAPLLAMHWGFSRVTLLALACYALAALLARALPAER